jgi:hypothetical protein
VQPNRRPFWAITRSTTTQPMSETARMRQQTRSVPFSSPGYAQCRPSHTWGLPKLEPPGTLYTWICVLAPPRPRNHHQRKRSVGPLRTLRIAASSSHQWRRADVVVAPTACVLLLLLAMPTQMHRFSWTLRSPGQELGGRGSNSPRTPTRHQGQTLPWPHHPMTHSVFTLWFRRTGLSSTTSQQMATPRLSGPYCNARTIRAGVW